MKVTLLGLCLTTLLLLPIPTSAQSPQKPAIAAKKAPVKPTVAKKPAVKKVVAVKPAAKSAPKLPATSAKPPASLAGQKVFGVSY